MMNAEQAKALTRDAITTFGPLLVAHGYGTSSTWEVVGGVVIWLIPIVWGQFSHTQAAAVAVVDAIAKEPDSPVRGVILEPTVAGRELANNLPGLTTVTADTTAAKEMAKA